MPFYGNNKKGRCADSFRLYGIFVIHTAAQDDELKGLRRNTRYRSIYTYIVYIYTYKIHILMYFDAYIYIYIYICLFAHLY